MYSNILRMNFLLTVLKLLFDVIFCEQKLREKFELHIIEASNMSRFGKTLSFNTFLLLSRMQSIFKPLCVKY